MDQTRLSFLPFVLTGISLLAGIGSLAGAHLALQGQDLILLGRSGRTDAPMVASIISGAYQTACITLCRSNVASTEEAFAALHCPTSSAIQSIVHSGMRLKSVAGAHEAYYTKPCSAIL